MSSDSLFVAQIATLQLFHLLSYLPMDLIHSLLLDLPSGTIYLVICMILNLQ